VALDLLRGAGVDMEKPEPSLTRFSDPVTKREQLL
jgi:hypothetical protein